MSEHTRLDPDESIDQGIVSGGGWTGSETGSLDVAPLAPFGPDCELAGTALVDDEVGGESLGCEEGGEGFGVVGFVPRVAPLGEVLAGDGNVGCGWLVWVIGVGGENRYAYTYSCSWRRWLQDL